VWCLCSSNAGPLPHHRQGPSRAHPLSILGSASIYGLFNSSLPDTQPPLRVPPSYGDHRIHVILTHEDILGELI
jgi:hypothetical protein